VNEPFHQSSLRESSHQKDQKLHSRQWTLMDQSQKTHSTLTSSHNPQVKNRSFWWRQRQTWRK
jgi:hypothetical protein